MRITPFKPSARCVLQLVARVTFGLVALPLGLLAVQPNAAIAADISWDDGSTVFATPITGGDADQLWGTASNWRTNNSAPHTPPNNDVLPGTGDRANIGYNTTTGGGAALFSTGTVTVNSLRVGVNPGLGVGGDGRLDITGGTLNVLNGGGTGDNGRVIVGNDARAGTLNVSGAAGLRLNVGENLVIGFDPTAGTDFIGTVNQTGGTVAVGVNLLYGGGGNRNGGVYNLNSGTLSVTGNITRSATTVPRADLYINGGTLNMSGDGDITVINFRLGETSGSTGSHTIENGEKITVQGGSFHVGNNGKGILTVNDGGEIVSNKGFVLANANVAGSEGELTVGTVGGSVGTLTITGGNFETANNRKGTVTFNSGTLKQNDSNLIVNQGGNSNGSFTLNGGLIDLQNSLRFNGGTGVFTQNGGTVNVGNILDIGNSNGGNGTYRMTGGILNVGDRVNSDLKIGNFNNASTTALMEIIDGTVNVGKSIRIADNGVNSSGKLIVGSGTTSPTINLNTGIGSTGNNDGNFETGDNGKGTFELKSGTVVLNDNNLITGQAANSKATVTIGGFAAPALLDVNGGDGLRDWNTNGGNGIVTVKSNGTIDVGRDINMGNSTNANSGLELTIEGGTVRVGANGSSTGNINYRNNGPKDQINLKAGLLAGNGGTINLNDAPDSAFSFTGGTLQNFATFTNGNLTQNNTDSASRLRIGDAGAVSTTTMAINGDYTLTGGTLEIDIDNPTADKLNVTGTADLGGIIEILPLSAFSVDLFDEYDVLMASSITDSGFSLDFSAVTFTGGAQIFFPRIVSDGAGGDILRLIAVVPEPSTLIIFSLGLLFLPFVRRRKRTGR